VFRAGTNNRVNSAPLCIEIASESGEDNSTSLPPCPDRRRKAPQRRSADPTRKSRAQRCAAARIHHGRARPPARTEEVVAARIHPGRARPPARTEEVVLGPRLRIEELASPAPRHPGYQPEVVQFSKVLARIYLLCKIADFDVFALALARVWRGPSTAVDERQTILIDILNHLVRIFPPALHTTSRTRGQTSTDTRAAAAGAQDVVPAQRLISECKELLREVREHRNFNADTVSQYHDVAASTAAGQMQSSEAPLGDLRLQPSFLRTLSLALQKGARDKSGLFAAPASIALSSIVEALARILCDNAADQDLAARSSPSVTLVLHFVMQSGNKDAVGWAAMALSQIAIRRPETAISM